LFLISQKADETSKICLPISSVGHEMIIQDPGLTGKIGSFSVRSLCIVLALPWAGERREMTGLELIAICKSTQGEKSAMLISMERSPLPSV